MTDTVSTRKTNVLAMVPVAFVIEALLIAGLSLLIAAVRS